MIQPLESMNLQMQKVYKDFQKLLSDLPLDIQKLAKEAYTHFKSNPYHPGLHFKRVHSTKPIFSVRISLNTRALGLQNDNEIIWFWIGSHSEYDKLLNKSS